MEGFYLQPLATMILDTLLSGPSKEVLPEKFSHGNLYKCYRKLRSIENILIIVNINYALFVNFLSIVRTRISSYSSSMTIQWYGKADFLLHIMCPVETNFSFTFA